jgi:hypothetical protein
MPIGLRGIVVAGLLAALMSSLAGVFNASSTLFTMDFYQKLHPTCDAAAARVDRPRGNHGDGAGRPGVDPGDPGGARPLRVPAGGAGYLAPPIFAVFFFGVFMKRLNAKGCLSALVVGFLLGVFRLAVDTPVTLRLDGFEQGYPVGSFLWIVNNIYFQYYSLLIFIISTAVLIGVSYMTEADRGAHLRHHHRSTPPRNARELEHAGCLQLRHRAGADPGGVPVLHRLRRSYCSCSVSIVSECAGNVYVKPFPSSARSMLRVTGRTFLSSPNVCVAFRS